MSLVECIMKSTMAREVMLPRKIQAEIELVLKMELLRRGKGNGHTETKRLESDDNVEKFKCR